MKKQSKNLISLIVLLAVLCTGYATVSFGAPAHNIKYTKHNFSTTAEGKLPSQFRSTDETEICIFCHTPHNSVPGQKFLWNRTNTVTTFSMYTSSPTLDFTGNPSAPSEVSKMCMTCHDGAGSINAMANPRTVTLQGFDQLGDAYPDDFYNPDTPGWEKNIGNARISFPDNNSNVWTEEGASPDAGGLLTNDHPISFLYSQSEADPTIKTADGAGGSSIGGLPLWYSNDNGLSGYKVECVTCHDPHINYNASLPFPDSGRAAYRPFLRKTMNSSSLCFTCHNK